MLFSDASLFSGKNLWQIFVSAKAKRNTRKNSFTIARGAVHFQKFRAISRDGARTTVPSRRDKVARAKAERGPCRSRAEVGGIARIEGCRVRAERWRVGVQWGGGSPAARFTADGSPDARRRGAAARQDVSSPSHRATVGPGSHGCAHTHNTYTYTIRTCVRARAHFLRMDIVARFVDSGRD